MIEKVHVVRTLLAIGLGIAPAISSAAAQSANPRRPALFATLEGGWNCAMGEGLQDKGSSGALGDRGCSGTGAIGLGMSNAPIGYGWNSWGLALRQSATRDSASLPRGTDIEAARFSEKRFVIDANIGRPLPALPGLGWIPGTTTVLVGVRYANYSGDVAATLTSAGVPDGSFNGGFRFSGYGPTIGTRSTIPLGTQFRFDSETIISFLVGHSGYRENDYSSGGTPTAVTRLSNGNRVLAMDSSYALTYAPSGVRDRGIEISAGVRTENWSSQLYVKGLTTGNVPTYDRDRNSFGPFARVRVPLD